MSIIAQEYEVEFKKYIKKEINQKIDEISSTLFENLFTYSEDKYLKIVSNLQTDIKSLIIEIIKKAISYFDALFRNSPERKRIIILTLGKMKELMLPFGARFIFHEPIMLVRTDKHIFILLMSY